MSTSYIGQPTSRVDGRAKVTGQAKYAAEFNVPNLIYGFVVSSEIAKGRIQKIDASEALNLKGVLQIFTHENAPDTAWFDSNYRDETAPHGSPFRPLHNDEIKYSGQPIALVVAETFEIARYAATLVHVEYSVSEHITNLDAKREQAYKPKMRSGTEEPPKPRGDAQKAFESAATQHEAQYSSPVEHHNPIEMFASTVVWEDDNKLTVYDKTQGALNSHQYVCKVFGYSDDNVRVISPYVGGAFGSGLRPQYQLFLAVLAARALKRSVRVSLTRQQMFTFGHRPNTVQKLALGAAPDGTLSSVIHDVVAETSQFEDFTEAIVNWSGLLYQCDNVKFDYKLAKLDLYTPMDMRAPGAVLGVYALECAMDELAYKAGIDPLKFRIKNYAEQDQNENKPFSSKELRECYRQGAEKFGWAKRNPEPRSMRSGDNLIGWGVATGVWDAQQKKASAKAILSPDGKLEVSSATADIGTGTYTIMTQIASETLGLPIDDVTFKLGDSKLVKAPIEGGSWTASSVGSAVKAVCEKICKKLLIFAQQMENSPFQNASIEDVTFQDEQIKLNHDSTQTVSITAAMRHSKVNSIEEETTEQPNLSKQSQYTRNSHSAVFCEVMVDSELGTIHVTRVVSAIAGGRILNPKTARSQILGAVVWGIGMALQEESVIDQKFGRFMNHNLAEYHVPVNADVHDIEVIFVLENDTIVNPLGAKGLGEIGIVGVAAAISNAIFHATGKRIRDLPITLDKLL